MVTPKEVLALKQPTNGFLCPLSSNQFGIEFLSFRIRDMNTSKTLFEVNRDDIIAAITTGAQPEGDDKIPDENTLRLIRYDFGPDFLSLKTIGTTLVFSVGPQAVPSFRMIERHYFGDRLIQSFDFTFGFCIPNSTNSWEAIYQMPKLTEREKREMIANPYKTKSDSFYFVNDELIMHNKAEYSYSPKK